MLFAMLGVPPGAALAVLVLAVILGAAALYAKATGRPF
jgi:hypothetical protein